MTPVGHDELALLLRRRLADVLGAAEADVTPEARLAEDLHADSLDVLEVVEGVEADLRQRGVDVRLPEEEMTELRTVGDALRRIGALAGVEATS